MPPIKDTNIPHEQGVVDAVDDHMERTSAVGVLADIPAAAAAPTMAEFNALVASHNSALTVLREAGLIPVA